jgi:hypothetical protein
MGIISTGTPPTPAETEQRQRLRQRLKQRLEQCAQLSTGDAASSRPPPASTRATAQALPVHATSPPVRYGLNLNAVDVSLCLLDPVDAQTDLPPYSLGCF